MSFNNSRAATAMRVTRAFMAASSRPTSFSRCSSVLMLFIGFAQPVQLLPRIG